MVKMIRFSRAIATVGLLLLFTTQVFATPNPGAGKFFDRAIFVIFENTNYSAAIKQPFFKQLADKGAHFSNFLAITHPSQGNYIALTSGDLNGVTGNSNYNLNVPNIADLLDAKGITWKIYAEDYPGNCFLGKTSSGYARKHNPFISYVSIQKNPSRCANIVDSKQFDIDVANDDLPNYVFFVPNLDSDGHDTGVDFAGKWYQEKFGPLLNNPQFMANTILISTFDESGAFSSQNQIYVSIVGPQVKPSVVATRLNLYSLLGLVEENWNLGNMGKNDMTAAKIPNIWK